MNKLLTFLCLIVLLIACDATANKEPIVVVPPTTNTPNPVNGANGSNGSAGDAGVNGSNGANGQPGSNGQNGTPGPQGAPGTNGTDNHIAKSWECDTSFDPCVMPFRAWIGCDTVSNFHTQIWYYATQTTYGDTTVRLGVDANNEGHQSTDIYAAGDWNAQNGYNAMRFDLYGSAIAGNGVWESWLNKNANSLRIRYTDTDMPFPGYQEWNTGCQQFNW